MSLLLWLPTRGTLPEPVPVQDDGPEPVVFLHGTLASPGNFGEPAHELARRGIPVLAPAYGRRGTGDLMASHAELTELFDAFFTDHPGIPSVRVVGHSQGGVQGLWLAQRFPGKVSTLVGLGCPFLGLPSKWSRLKRGLVGTVAGRAFIQLQTRTPWPTDVPDGTRVISVVSDGDGIIPSASCDLGEVRTIHGIRHEVLPAQTRPILEALGIAVDSNRYE